MGVFAAIRTVFQSKENRRASSNSVSKESSTSIGNYTANTHTSSKSTDSYTDQVLTAKQINSEAGGYNYQYKDGRRYHAQKDVAYLLPNDDDEVDRVHQQHWILCHAFQRNFHAPVDEMLSEGITVLDSGCGPATWTFEIGETYPRSKIYGVDASCVFPENVKPANVEFSIGNIAKRIPHEDNMFDYIHQRLLIMGLTDEDWGNALKEHYRVLKPGGYIELVEVNFKNLAVSGPYMNTIHQAFKIVTERRGVVLNVALELETRLTRAGFENAVEKVGSIPFNHGGKIGELIWNDFRELCSSIRPALIKANPDLEGEGVFENCLKECAREVAEYKVYVEFYIVYAQKPRL